MLYVPRNADSGRSDGRLTLTTGTPVTTSDVTAAGTLYYTPTIGDRESVYDGTLWAYRPFDEISLAPSLTSGNNYDVFTYPSGNTIALEVLAWTNTTTRATALVMHNGKLCKSGDLTRKYKGTLYASGTNQITDSITTRGLWNVDNQVSRLMRALETTSSWTMNSATFRAVNNNSTSRLYMVRGLDIDAVTVTAQTRATTAATATLDRVLCSIGVDGTTQAVGAYGDGGYLYSSGSQIVTATATYDGYPGLGLRYLQQLEATGAAATVTFYGGTASGSNGQTSIHGTVMA